ncbi:hypothetical protein [Tenacibaculum agarivorans]|uniref:hypothetical protein n=1 Tax=Tenacibaculum agarivorans TaxID=1908389 RepID=UPI0013564275|nr:hypothetical protein [Tenacibaculum agarivorans]
MKTTNFFKTLTKHQLLQLKGGRKNNTCNTNRGTINDHDENDDEDMITTPIGSLIVKRK